MNMKKEVAIELLLDLISIGLCFINWRIGLALFLVVGFIFHVAVRGPRYTLNTITGILVIAAIVYLFFNWKISIILAVSSYLVARFNVWATKVNHDYYNKKSITESKDKK